MAGTKTSDRIERYLAELDQALDGVPTQEKCDIVMEIHAHIKDRTVDQHVDIENVLRALGSPESVANRYRMQRGLPMVQPKKRHTFRWVFVTLASVFLICVVGVILLIYSLQPIIKIDEDSVEILGGMIKIDAENIDFDDHTFDQQFDFHFQSAVGKRVKGSVAVAGVSQFQLSTNNSALTFEPSSSDAIGYQCRFDNQLDVGSLKDHFKTEDGILKLTLSGRLGNNWCVFKVPLGLSLDVSVKNGKVALKNLEQDQKVLVKNGTVLFMPHNIHQYEIDARVRNGVLRLPEQTNTPKRFKAHLRVRQGALRYKNPEVE